MGTFSRINTVFSGIVTTLYPSTKQSFATPDLVSQEDLAEGQDLFGLYQNYTVIPDLRGNTDTAQNIGFFIGGLDSFDSSPAELNALIDTYEAKAKAIVQAFQDAEEVNRMSIDTFSLIPYYKQNSETLTGVWALFEIKVAQSLDC